MAFWIYRLPATIEQSLIIWLISELKQVESFSSYLVDMESIQPDEFR